MSEDPETARQIAELSLDTRPLLVLDVDDVLIEFLRPFIRYLDAQDLDLSLATFRLHGNVSRRRTREVLDQDAISELIDSFFGVQGNGNHHCGAQPTQSRRCPATPRSFC